MCLLSYKPVTWQRTAKDLHSHTDIAAGKPRARVDSNVSGHHWHWEDVPDRNFLFSVATEDLLRQTHSIRWWNEDEFTLCATCISGRTRSECFVRSL